MKKLINVRVDEDLLEKFKKICEKKGINMTNVCIDCIKNFVKKNEQLLINTQEEEEYEVLTDLFDSNYQKYKIILTKEDLGNIYNTTIEEKMMENGEYDFENNFEQHKKTYIINKLIEMKKGKNWGAIRNQEGVFELVEDGYIYNRFNAFIFKEGKLIEGNYMSIGHILLQIKEEN